MPLPLQNTASGSPGSGTLVTPANSGGLSGNAFDSVVGAFSFVPNTGHVDSPPVPLRGPHCYLAAQPTSSQAKGMWTASLGSVTEYWWREYRVIGNAPVANVVMHQMRGPDASSAMGNCFSARLNTNRTVSLLAIGVVAYTSTEQLPLNQLIRLEYHAVISSTAGHIEAWAFWNDGVAGHGPESTTSSLTLGNLTDNLNTRVAGTELNFGLATATTGNRHWVDSAYASTTGPIGPQPAVTPSPWYVVLPDLSLQSAVLRSA